MLKTLAVVMAQVTTSELETTFTQYERHLIGLFAIVALEPSFLRSFPEETQDIVEAHIRSIEPLQAWSVDPNVTDLIETDESVFAILALIQTSWGSNANIVLGYSNNAIFIDHA